MTVLQKFSQALFRAEVRAGVLRQCPGCRQVTDSDGLCPVCWAEVQGLKDKGKPAKDGPGPPEKPGKNQPADPPRPPKPGRNQPADPPMPGTQPGIVWQ